MRSTPCAACWLLVLSLLCCMSLSCCYVTISDVSGQSFTFDQSTAASSFPAMSVPALAALGFTVLTSADIGYVNIHVAIPNSTTNNSTYNYVAHLNATNSLPFGTDMVTASDLVAGTSVFFTVGWLGGTAAVDTPSLIVFTSANSANAVGDPQFHGFLGQSYQVHGTSNTVFSLISDALVQVNAVFVFLTEGRCPSAALELPLHSACWSHPGSYLGRLTLQSIAGRLHRRGGRHGRLWLQQSGGQWARATSGRGVTGNEVSGVDHPHAHHLSRTHCTLRHSHILQCHVGLFALTITNSDGFVNLHEVSVSDWTALTHEVRSHGLLGQTWQRRGGRRSGRSGGYGG